MSSKSKALVTLMCAKSCGFKSVEESGIVKIYGGMYHPQSEAKTYFAPGPEARIIPARWECNFVIDTSGTGPIIARLVAWNTPYDEPGKGHADIFAKIVTPGKEVSCSASIVKFIKRLYINGVKQVDHMGNDICIPTTIYKVEHSILWGEDSRRIINEEISEYNKNPNGNIFLIRPKDWDYGFDEEYEGRKKWKEILKERMSIIYDGGDTYGHAKVIHPQP